MKQNILFRLFAIVLFGLASLVIKSESSCKINLNCKAKKTAQSSILMLDQKLQIPIFPLDEGFLMKI